MTEGILPRSLATRKGIIPQVERTVVNNAETKEKCIQINYKSKMNLFTLCKLHLFSFQSSLAGNRTVIGESAFSENNAKRTRVALAGDD